MRHADAEGSANLTFANLPLEQGVELVKKMTRHSAVSFAGELTFAAYEHVPVSLVLCEKDVVVPPDFQTKVIETIERESGRKVDVVRLPESDHCPNVSRPVELGAAIMDAIVVS